MSRGVTLPQGGKASGKTTRLTTSAAAKIPTVVAATSVAVLLIFLVVATTRRFHGLDIMETSGGLIASVAILLTVSRSFVASRVARPIPTTRDDLRAYVAPAELPPVPASFVGREREIGRIRELLTGHRGSGPAIVVLHGPDGIGKTALAVRAARMMVETNPGRYAGGQLFVNLSRRRLSGRSGTSTIDDKQLLDFAFTSLFQALKEPGDILPATPQKRAEFFHARTRPESGHKRNQIVIVLDDADSAALVNRLLPPSPSSAVIVTSSREMVGVTNRNRHVLVPPLQVDESLELLGAVAKGQIDGEQDAARRIIEDTGGYPFAVHLAAASIASRPHARLVALNELNAHRVSSRSGDEGARHISLSYSLLGSGERNALKLIPLLNMSAFEEWHVAAVLGIAELDAGRVLDRLATAGLIRKLTIDSEGSTVFSIDSGILAFATARLNESVPRHEQASMAYQLEDAKQQRSIVSDSHTSRLGHEAWAAFGIGRLDQAFQKALRALAAARARADGNAEAFALAALAEVHCEFGNFAVAEDLAMQSMADSAASDGSTARALRCLGRLNLMQGNLAQARKEQLRARISAHRVDDTAEEIRVVRDLTMTVALIEPNATKSLVKYMTGQLEKHREEEIAAERAGVHLAEAVALAARRLHAKAAERLTAASNEALLRNQRVLLGWIELQSVRLDLDLGRYDSSRDHAYKAIDIFSQMRHRHGKAHARLLIGRSYASSLEWRLAAPMLEEALQNFADCGDKFMEAETARCLSEAYQEFHGLGQKSAASTAGPA